MLLFLYLLTASSLALALYKRGLNQGQALAYTRAQADLDQQAQAIKTIIERV